MKKPLKATPAVVSKALTAAYHVKSTTSTTRIRGWHNVSSGFVCIIADDGACLVFYRSSSDYQDQAKKRIEGYLATLRSLFAVQLLEGSEPYLRVTTMSLEEMRRLEEERAAAERQRKQLEDEAIEGALAFIRHTSEDRWRSILRNAETRSMLAKLLTEESPNGPN